MPTDLISFSFSTPPSTVNSQQSTIIPVQPELIFYHVRSITLIPVGAREPIIFAKNGQSHKRAPMYYGRSIGHDITIHCAVALSVTALVIKALTSVSGEKVEAFITIAIIAKETLHPETKQLD